jgi:hypothetical protein
LDEQRTRLGAGGQLAVAVGQDTLGGDGGGRGEDGEQEVGEAHGDNRWDGGTMVGGGWTTKSPNAGGGRGCKRVGGRERRRGEGMLAASLSVVCIGGGVEDGRPVARNVTVESLSSFVVVVGRTPATGSGRGLSERATGVRWKEGGALLASVSAVPRSCWWMMMMMMMMMMLGGDLLTAGGRAGMQVPTCCDDEGSTEAPAQLHVNGSSNAGICRVMETSNNNVQRYLALRTYNNNNMNNKQHESTMNAKSIHPIVRHLTRVSTTPCDTTSPHSSALRDATIWNDERYATRSANPSFECPEKTRDIRIYNPPVCHFVCVPRAPSGMMLPG